jgi:hypothetical protein
MASTPELGELLRALGAEGRKVLEKAPARSGGFPAPGKGKASKKANPLTGCTPCAANAQVEAAKKWLGR